MGVFDTLLKPSLKQGIYRTGGGYYKAYYNGVCVAYHKERYYCNEVYIMYKTGQLKV
jgi:hypothetical protein